MSILRLPIAVVAGFMTTPVFALSCLPPDVARTYKQADEAEEAYVVARGELSFDEALLPVVDLQNQQATPEETRIPAHLKGDVLTSDGFDAAFDQDITLNVHCFGPWCGGAASGTDYLAFLQVKDEGYTLNVTPCGGFEFSEPSQKTLDRVVQCMQGGPCEEQPF